MKQYLEALQKGKVEEMEQEKANSSSHVPFDYHELVPPDFPPNTQEDPRQPDSIAFIDEPNLKVFCKDCRKEINKTTSIICNNIYRCVVCFAKSDISEESYQVIKSLHFPLIEQGWKAIHEILFLTFLEKFGVGNWREIKDQMDFYGARHKEEDLEAHYFHYYISSEDYLPKLLNNDSFFQKKCDPIASVKNSAINPTSMASLTTAHQPDQYEQIDCFYANHLGMENRQTAFLEYYNKNRNEFEVQYDQDAEFLLANLEFRDDDTEEETKIKFRLIQQYNKRLDRRNHVKQFVLEHRLLEQNYQKETDKLRTDFEKEAFEELKPIARFTTLNQYNNLVRKVSFTKQLKTTIEGLRKFRRTHPSNFKSLDEFLSSQPEESRPRKKNHGQNAVKTGKKVEQMLEKHFRLNKREFETLLSNLAANGKKAVFRNVEATLLQSTFEA